MFDELDEYICTCCGKSSETCFCEDNSYEYNDDEFPEDDYDESFNPEFVCYLNGEPLYMRKDEEIK